MEGFLFNSYQLISVFLYLFLSVLLIYHRFFRRWIYFSFGFFIAYLIGSYVFFGQFPIPFVSAKTFGLLPYFLFFFGTVACLGFCQINELNLRQSSGIFILYFFLLSIFLFLSGKSIGIDLTVPEKGAVERFITSAPYILFFVGSPIAVGYWMYGGKSPREIIGAYIIFFFSLVLAIILTTNYFNQPFGFFYEFEPHARYWIEMSSILVAVLGIPAIIGFCLINSMSSDQALGLLILFLVIMVGVFTVMHLTMGHELLAKIIGNGSRLFS